MSQLEQLYQQFMAQGEERRREPLVRWRALQLLHLFITKCRKKDMFFRFELLTLILIPSRL